MAWKIQAKSGRRCVLVRECSASVSCEVRVTFDLFKTENKPQLCKKEEEEEEAIPRISAGVSPPMDNGQCSVFDGVGGFSGGEEKMRDGALGFFSYRGFDRIFLSCFA
uniref:Uncharacterized protein n=1 Tax=Nelumbo nucifera TaxID=4432 RepID=A0A822Z2T9_NELNU|nr:TPA_asm: hypothetical protein HUJ06_006448 [Nelumbo nucifera]